MPSLEMFQRGDDDRVRRFAAGADIYTQGEPGNDMYVVVEGEAEIVIGGHVVETVGPTGFFGEMALVGHTTRSASVRAKTDVALEVIDEKRFEYLVRNAPFFALEVMRTMASRLRRMDEPLR